MAAAVVEARLMVCAVVPSIDNLATSLIAYVDCQTMALATRGYATLTGAGGLVPSLLLALLTIFIALWGYRLLAGARPDGTQLLSMFARVGIVLTLASSWPAYQRLIYDVVLQTPAQVAGTIDMSGTGRDDATGLAARLDDTDLRFVRLAVFGSGAPQTPEEAALLRANTPPPLFQNFDSFAFGVARLTFLVSAVGSFATVRLLSGAILALGPLIVMFLLFDATRGLVAGWARALVGLVAAGIVAVLIIDVETVLLTPWLSDLLAKRAADQAIYGASSQLLATTIIFAVVIFAGLRLSQRLVTTVWPMVSGATYRDVATRQGEMLLENRASQQRDILAMGQQEQRRAQAIAEAISVADHRRTRLAGGRPESAPAAGQASGTGLAPGWTASAVRSNYGSDRRVTVRGSASSARRDRR
jgi:type IV secretion system protein VirB6